MTPHFQLFSHYPENGEFGDCDRTCIASLLDLPLEEVPHWGVHYNDPDKFNEEKDKFLSSQGLKEVNILFGCTKEEVLGTMKNVNSGIYHILTGESESGVNHAVICLNGEIVHDPSQDSAGIIGPCDDGHFWVSFYVPIQFTKEK